MIPESKDNPSSQEQIPGNLPEQIVPGKDPSQQEKPSKSPESNDDPPNRPQIPGDIPIEIVFGEDEDLTGSAIPASSIPKQNDEGLANPGSTTSKSKTEGSQKDPSVSDDGSSMGTDKIRQMPIDHGGKGL